MITWRSAKLSRVARSTLTAETLALSEGLDAGILFDEIFEEMTDIQCPINVYTDSYGLRNYFTKLPANKRLRVDISLRSTVSDDPKCQIRWIGSNLQIADCLTKDSRNSSKQLEECQLNNCFPFDVSHFDCSNYQFLILIQLI